MKRIISAFFYFLISISTVFSQQILLDEDFSDWSEIETEFNDSQGDSDDLDLLGFKITNDDRFIYFLIELDREIELQEDNDLFLYIDTDNNAETGTVKSGIGYEFEFEFAQRTGRFHNGQSIGFSPYDVGLIASPTVTSNKFEFKLNLGSIVGGTKVFNSNEISILFESSSGIDLLPDAGSSAVFQYDLGSQYESRSFQLAKPTSTDLRVLSYNVRRDGLFDPSLKQQYQRIISAIQPDIIGFQEVYNNSGQQATTLVEEFIPSSDGSIWYHGDSGTDNLIVSRYPILNEATIYGNSVYLLDAGDRYIFTIVAHPPCCSNENGRQDEIDAFMGFLRDSKNGSGFDIPENTPILILGDMNLVGLRQQQATLITGDIVNEGIHGADFNPDWDGTALDDSKPMNPGIPTTFTWYNPNSSFGAGRLDYLVYSGSVLDKVNSFSLHTPSLDQDSLQFYGLESNDTIEASDHIPVVVDFKFKTPTSNENGSSLELPRNFNLGQNYPNPFNPSTTIPFTIHRPASLSLSIHSVNGTLISSLLDNQFYSSGDYSVFYDADQLASGVYFYRLMVDGQVENKQMILVK